MAGYRGGGSGILSQYTGFPALIFFILKDSATRCETISARLNMLVHIFAYLRATLYEKPELVSEENEKIILDIDQRIKTARSEYQGIFEQESTYTKEENEFLQSLDGILYLEAELIAKTKLIENQRLTEMMVPAADT